MAGKKAQKRATAAEQQQLSEQSTAFGNAGQQLGTAANYWNALLKGGQAAMNAVGPTASLVGQNAEGARQAIQAYTPRGGEQNLALAQNWNTASNNIARLYAGMQPLAAQGLTGIGNSWLQAGAPQVGSGIAGLVSQQGMSNTGAAGAGSMLYNSLSKQGQGGGGGGMGGKAGGMGGGKGGDMGGDVGS